MGIEQLKTTLVTGAARLIGNNISKRLFYKGWRVMGLDSILGYYEVLLNERRDSIFMLSAFYRSMHKKVEMPKVLLNFIVASEKSIGISAVKNLMPIQAWDIPTTCAYTALLQALIGYKPNTDLSTGMRNFVNWHLEYCNP